MPGTVNAAIEAAATCLLLMLLWSSSSSQFDGLPAAVDAFVPAFPSTSQQQQQHLQHRRRHLHQQHQHPTTITTTTTTTTTARRRGTTAVRSNLATAAALLPRVIVFDLDNTLWTPELYQLRRRRRSRGTGEDHVAAAAQPAPVAGKDVVLLPGARQVLEEILPKMVASSSSLDDGSGAGPPAPLLAIASRTDAVEWAHSLVDQFGLRESFVAVEIFPGSKTRHFANIRRVTGVPYGEMVFFDDARDGKYGNCEDVARLGVLAVHCPQGLATADIFTRALHLYRTEWLDKAPNTIVEWDGRLTTTTPTAKPTLLPLPTRSDRPPQSSSSSSSNSNSSIGNNTPGKNRVSSAPRLEGTVRLVRPERGYGFIRYRGPVQSRDVFFHFNHLVVNEGGGYDHCDDDGANDDDNDNAAGGSKRRHDALPIQEGDAVSFQIQQDPRNDKDMAVNVKVASAPSSSSSIDDDVGSGVQFRCFSMNQPFAALLANGHKMLETRNGTMFVPYAEGTQMLLHVGRRTYPDGGKHADVMREHHNVGGESNNMGDAEMDRLRALPPGFSRGSIVAIVELGRTYETTEAERCHPGFERTAVAYGRDSGKFATEIKRVAYLKRPIKLKGEGGVFKVRIDPSVIPDEFNVPTTGCGSASVDAAYATISG